MEKTAIISVFDKTGLIPLVDALISHNFKILSSGGTARYLTENGYNVQMIEDFTGQPEIMGGRVKTLHPKIHAGILARGDVKDDLVALEAVQSVLVDIVVVNLYPFVEKVRSVERNGQVNHESLIEDIDIGGPTMLRAAAKNCHRVAAVCDPSDYQKVIDEINCAGEVSLGTRRSLAAKVFTTIACYDAQIARYFSLDEKLLDESGSPHSLAPIEACVLKKESNLRYGENPHQQAALYRRVDGVSDGIRAQAESLWEQIQGKELSYNNILDVSAALNLFTALAAKFSDRFASVVIKHSNPCGAAIRDSALRAFVEARDCDPLSSFGGIVAIGGVVDEEFAQVILEGFVEVVILSELTDAASAVFKKKKNLRVLKCGVDAWEDYSCKQRWQVKCVADSFLLQTQDRSSELVSEAKAVTEIAPSAELLNDMEFAWTLAKYVTSNAIVLAKDLKAIGVGAGQMSRVDSAKLALSRAEVHAHDVKQSVAASDAFLPFADVLEVLNDAGIQGLVQPGGSRNDSVVIEAANARSMSMLFTETRHFRH